MRSVSRNMRFLPVWCLCAMLALAPLAASAASPLALLGRQLLSEVVKDFFKSGLASLAEEAVGPCKSMIAQMGTAGSIPGIASPLSGSSMRPGMGMPMMNPLLGQMDPAMIAQMDPAMREQMAQMTADLEAMRSAPPLSTEEVDELVDRLVEFSKAIPDHELPCSPEELKVVFGMSASMPMGPGPLRAMLDSFRGLDERCKKMHECFAQMTPAEEDEAIDLIVAEIASANPDVRKQLAGFVLTDIVCLPAQVREKLRPQLAAQHLSAILSAVRARLVYTRNPVDFSHTSCLA